MSAYDDLRQHRRDSIIDLLKKDAMTVQELAKLLEHNYYTVRLDVLDMVEQGMVRQVALRNRAIVYSAKVDALSGWPIVFENANKTKGQPLKNLMNLYRFGRKSDVVRAVWSTQQLYSKIILWANDIRTGHGYDAETIKREKENLSLAIVVLETYLERLKSLRDNARLWSKGGLEELLVIEDFPNKNSLKYLEDIEVPTANDMFVEFEQSLVNIIETKAKEFNNDSA